MGQVNGARADRIAIRTGHNAHDSLCMHWAGDFAGVDLRAVCKPCREWRAGVEDLVKPARKRSKLGKIVDVLRGRL